MNNLIYFLLLDGLSSKNSWRLLILNLYISAMVIPCKETIIYLLLHISHFSFKMSYLLIQVYL